MTRATFANACEAFRSIVIAIDSAHDLGGDWDVACENACLRLSADFDGSRRYVSDLYQSGALAADSALCAHDWECSLADEFAYMADSGDYSVAPIAERLAAVIRDTVESQLWN